jgi:two-component system, LuxR family, sensor kinase FixL
MAVSEWRHVTQTLETREAELNRAMRVAAAAEMASALAHELNQPLTAASNYLQACDIMLARDAHAPSDLANVTRKASAEVERAGDVVRRLRDFYRGGPARRESVSVSDIFADSVKPLKARIERHNVRIVERLAAAPRVAVDRVQISMVLHNLVANALDSVGSSPGDAREIAVDASPEGAMVRISVHDTGPGIAPSIAGQLFETFATSKPTGMGLGLAISRSIVESHGGRLWLEPSTWGARFTLTLPAAP